MDVQTTWLTVSVGRVGLELAAALAAGVLGTAALVYAALRLRGTTLAAACLWALAAMLLGPGVECLAAIRAAPQETAWLVHARYVAAVMALAPGVAVLGAKRPQNRAWQFIVVALLAVLWEPSLVAVVYHGGGPSPHTALSWLMAALIGIGWLNHLPTRFGAAITAAALGQVCLLSDYLPLDLLPGGAWRPLAGWCLCAAGAGAALASAAGKPAARGVEGLWLDFRDAVGTMWALRVVERFNATARSLDWPVTLAWRGLQAAGEQGKADSGGEGPIASDVKQAATRQLVALARRFVSQQWIDCRLGGDGQGAADG